MFTTMSDLIETENQIFFRYYREHFHKDSPNLEKNLEFNQTNLLLFA